MLERLSGALCDAVTGRPGSQALLEQIEREGLFLVPLDEVRGWWRYHHLFADLLRARLEQEPGRVAELHKRAAAWYEDHGLADEAIRHAAAAGRDDSRRPSSSSGTSTGCTASGARERRSSDGSRHSLMTWPGPVPGCCWPRRR